MIPYGKHYLDEDDINAVVDVLRNGALTQGPKIVEFERAITKYTGSKYAVAVSSGTAALHLACMAADISTGDELLTTTNTFVASSKKYLLIACLLWLPSNWYTIALSWSLKSVCDCRPWLPRARNAKGAGGGPISLMFSSMILCVTKSEMVDII